MESGVARARRRMLEGVPAQTADVTRLRAAAARENVLVLAYAALIDLPVVGATGTTLPSTLSAFRDQHAEHAAAFNAATVRRGGSAQVEPDPDQLRAVRSALPGLTSAAATLALAATVEAALSEAYVQDTETMSTAALRALFAAVAAVEAEHVGALQTAGAMVAAGLTSPAGGLRGLPAAVGTAGLPPASAVAPARGLG